MGSWWFRHARGWSAAPSPARWRAAWLGSAAAAMDMEMLGVGGCRGRREDRLLAVSPRKHRCAARKVQPQTGDGSGRRIATPRSAAGVGSGGGLVPPAPHRLSGAHQGALQVSHEAHQRAGKSPIMTEQIGIQACVAEINQQGHFLGRQTQQVFVVVMDDFHRDLPKEKAKRNCRTFDQTGVEPTGPAAPMRQWRGRSVPPPALLRLATQPLFRARSG